MKLAFVGPMHSGKTTAAKILQNLFFEDTGNSLTKVSFARELKERGYKFVTEQLGVTESIDEFKNTNEGRQFLQLCGRIGRKSDPAFWINFAEEDLKASPNAVMDDCRFMNEAYFLKEHGFMIVRVWRPFNERKLSATQAIMKQQNVDTRTANKMFEEQSKDDSETEQEGIVTDTTIAAGTINGSVVKLEDAVKLFYSNYKEGLYE